MGINCRIHQVDICIDTTLAEAFGYGEDQLADEYDRAASSEKSACVPSAPAGEFEKILACVEKKTGAAAKKPVNSGADAPGIVTAKQKGTEPAGAESQDPDS